MSGSASNVLGFLSHFLRSRGDVRGNKVTREKTMNIKYLYRIRVPVAASLKSIYRPCIFCFIRISPIF